MANQINPEFVAQVLAEASFSRTDKQIYDSYGISRQTFITWKKMLAEDKTLRQYFTQKKQTLETSWGNKAGEAILSGIDFLIRAGQQADPTDPTVIHAIAGGLKIVTEAQATLRYLDARLGQNAQSHSGAGAAIQQTGQALPPANNPPHTN